jgi:L-cysteate sulfo-lyase
LTIKQRQILDSFPHFALLDGPTPIQRLERLEAVLGDDLGGVHLYVKRDDHMPIGGGGNKLRKLEFLIGDALAKQADTIITVGGRQSNHARLTAAAAARAGLRCELVLSRQVPRDDVEYLHNGNILLDDLFGAAVHDLPGEADPLAYAKARASVLEAAGKKAYVVPSGGSSPIGCLGYASCALEIAEQSAQLGVSFARIIVANGSSGTHAGLAAGFAAAGLPPSLVKSYTVLSPREQALETTLDKSRATLRLLDSEAVISPEDIEVDGAHLGDGYGIPTPEMLSAVRTLARTEGLLLDPVYTGKAFGGLLSDLKANQYAGGQRLLFVMTGGTPALFAYRRAFTETSSLNQFRSARGES